MQKRRAVAYFRTSSAANVGEGKDTLPRQSEAVKKYALLENIEIVAEFYDANVRGVVKVEDRPEFGKMLTFCARNKIDMVLCETANRFSRDLMVQLMGHDYLKGMSIDLVPVDAPAHFQDEDNPTAELIRIMIGAVSQYEKKSLTKKLGDARERTRTNKGRCEGRIPPPDAAITMAKELRGQGLSFRAIGEKLSEAGFRVIEKNKKTGVAEVTDRVYQAMSVRNMIENL